MVAFALLLLAPATFSAPPPVHAGEIAAAMDGLNVLGNVLYVAAHPDDENTRLLTWLARVKHYRATYLSLTRGEGGQNLVGTEQGELLGLIRTQELLAARRIDGAEQRFSRARDFGYSKTAAETLRFWDRDMILGDVVWAIRRLRPDVVVTRFTPDPPNHGHHTASAILAAEAFQAAADPSRFPEQLAYVKPWQARRLLHNVSTWRLTPETDLSMYQRASVGDYIPLLGATVGELAARSRSMHKSQGFGVAAERGPIAEYFQPLAGDAGPKEAPFDGFDTSWARIPGGGAVAKLVNAARKRFDPRAPEASLPALAKVAAALAALKTEAGSTEALLVAQKREELEALLVACAGLTVEARAGQPGERLTAVSAGTEVPVSVALVARLGGAVERTLIRLPDGTQEPKVAPLNRNEPVIWSATLKVPQQPATNALGVFRLEQAPWTALATELGAPEQSDATLPVEVALRIAGVPVTLRVPLLAGWVDPVDGERTARVEVAPALSASFDRNAIMVPNGESVEVGVSVTSLTNDTHTEVRLQVPEGWRVSPERQPVTLEARNLPKRVVFRVSPASGDVAGGAVHVLLGDDPNPALAEARVTHAHIPTLTARETAEAKLSPVRLQGPRGRIGLIPGPGDRVGESLAAVGYTVVPLDLAQLEAEHLQGLDAVLVGVRAFNHRPELHGRLPALLAWVEGGGRLIVQYMTSSRLAPLRGEIGPYPLVIGQGRVTDETAELVLKDPKHPALTAPNALGPADYAGWVQERGLYFADKWDAQYTPIFSAADPGESPLEGSLLVARHGKGVYVYTGLAFFRQLPAGVPGAFRLLQNLLSLPVGGAPGP